MAGSATAAPGTVLGLLVADELVEERADEAADDRAEDVDDDELIDGASWRR